MYPSVTFGVRPNPNHDSQFYGAQFLFASHVTNGMIEALGSDSYEDAENPDPKTWDEVITLSYPQGVPLDYLPTNVNGDHYVDFFGAVMWMLDNNPEGIPDNAASLGYYEDPYLRSALNANPMIITEEVSDTPEENLPNGPENPYGLKRVWAEIYDLAEHGEYHNPAWTNNKLIVPCTYDAETDNFSIQTTGVDLTSWYQPDHVYHITLFAEDEAGNRASMTPEDDTYGDQLKIRVFERNKPEIKLTSLQDMYNTSTITIKHDQLWLRDGSDYVQINGLETDVTYPLDQCIPEDRAGSGVDVSTLKVYLDGALIETGISTNPSEWQAVVRELSEDDTQTDHIELGWAMQPATDLVLEDLAAGSHTLKVTVEDYDGNLTEESRSFLVHTQGPELVVLDPSAVVTLVGKSVTEYEFKVKVKGFGASNLQQLKAEYKNDLSGEVLDTKTITTFGDADADGYYTVLFTLPVYNVDTSGYDEYLHSYYTITATDTYGMSTSVSRQIDCDSHEPLIYDVETERTTVDAVTDKVKIRFRLMAIPPRSRIEIGSTGGNYVLDDGTTSLKLYMTKAHTDYNDAMDFYISPSAEIEYATMSVTPDTTNGASSGEVTVTKEDDSTVEKTHYTLNASYNCPDEMISTTYYKRQISVKFKGIDDIHTFAFQFKVMPVITNIGLSTFNMTDPKNFNPSWKLKVTPDVSGQFVTTAGIRYSTTKDYTNYTATIEKLDDESTEDYGVYSVKLNSPISQSVHLIQDKYVYHTYTLTQQMRIAHTSCNVYFSFSNKVNWPGLLIRTANVEPNPIKDPAVYSPEFDIIIKPPIGSLAGTSMGWGDDVNSVTRYDLNATITKDTSQSNSDQDVYHFKAPGNVSTQYTKLVAGVPQTLSSWFFFKHTYAPTTIGYEAIPVEYTIDPEFTKVIASTGANKDGLYDYYTPYIRFRVLPRNNDIESIGAPTRVDWTMDGENWYELDTLTKESSSAGLGDTWFAKTTSNFIDHVIEGNEQQFRIHHSYYGDDISHDKIFTSTFAYHTLSTAPSTFTLSNPNVTVDSNEFYPSIDLTMTQDIGIPKVEVCVLNENGEQVFMTELPNITRDEDYSSSAGHYHLTTTENIFDNLKPEYSLKYNGYWAKDSETEYDLTDVKATVTEKLIWNYAKIELLSVTGFEDPLLGIGAYTYRPTYKIKITNDIGEIDSIRIGYTKTTSNYNPSKGSLLDTDWGTLEKVEAESTDEYSVYFIDANTNRAIDAGAMSTAQKATTLYDAIAVYYSAFAEPVVFFTELHWPGITLSYYDGITEVGDVTEFYPWVKVAATPRHLFENSNMTFTVNQRVYIGMTSGGGSGLLTVPTTSEYCEEDSDENTIVYKIASTTDLAQWVAPDKFSSDTKVISPYYFTVTMKYSGSVTIKDPNGGKLYYVPSGPTIEITSSTPAIKDNRITSSAMGTVIFNGVATNADSVICTHNHPVKDENDVSHMTEEELPCTITDDTNGVKTWTITLTQNIGSLQYTYATFTAKNAYGSVTTDEISIYSSGI